MIKKLSIIGLIKLFNYKHKIIKSYREIRKKDISLLTKLNNELMLSEFINIKEFKSFEFDKFNISFDDFKYSIKQYYFSRLLNYRLNKYFLIFWGFGLRLIYPLPKKQLIILNKFIKVNFFLSSISYYFLSIFELLNSIFEILKLVINRNHFIKVNNGAYFYNLRDKNLKKNSNNNYGLINYSFQNFLDKNDKFIHSRKNINDHNLIYTFSPYRLEYSNNLIFSYIFFLLKFIYKSLILRNNSILFFFREIIKTYLLSKQKAHNFYKKYYFTHDNFYRPLWTYIAENKGSLIFLYFYSLNNSYTKFKDKADRFKTPLSLYTWNNYFVWNTSHQNFLKNIIPHNSKNTFNMTAPVSFFTNSENIYNSPKVVVFDIVPHSIINYATYGKPYEYELFWKTSNIFLNDIFNLSKKYNFEFGLKTKRQTQLTDKKYIYLIDKLKKNINFKFYDDSFSPEQIISKDSIVICFPFSSPAYFAKNLNSKVIYYDPLNKIQKDELNEIKLVSGFLNLDNYLKINL